MKDFLKAVLFVTVLFVLLFMLFPGEGTSSANDTGVMENEGIIVYKYVNFRSTPDSTNDDNIICKIYFGDTVDVVGVEGEWKKVIYDGQEGYLIGESVSEYYIMLDISDFNWGSEYDSIEEFKAFTERAKNSTKFVGYYIQVQRTFKENAHWKEITACLDEMGINYGLYLYSSATTQEGAAKEYESYLNIIDGVSLKYNKYPFMIDLEGVGNQTEVIKFYNSKLKDFILYAGASDMQNYGYYKLVDSYWIAHYGLCSVLPTQDYIYYENAKTVLNDADLWQFTSKGNKKLFGTEHLDVNIVSNDWYKKYAD